MRSVKPRSSPVNGSAALVVEPDGRTVLDKLPLVVGRYRHVSVRCQGLHGVPVSASLRASKLGLGE